MSDDGILRTFDSGATRDTAEGKLDYEGFLSLKVLVQFAKYMNMNRLQSDGKLRDSDNWQKGISMDAYMKSGYRHFMKWWEAHRCKGLRSRDGDIEDVGAMCGLMFNVMGYLHEWLKEHDTIDFDGEEPTFEMKERVAKMLGQEPINATKMESCSNCSHGSIATGNPEMCKKCFDFKYFKSME